MLCVVTRICLLLSKMYFPIHHEFFKIWKSNNVHFMMFSGLFLDVYISSFKWFLFCSIVSVLPNCVTNNWDIHSVLIYIFIHVTMWENTSLPHLNPVSFLYLYYILTKIYNSFIIHFFIHNRKSAWMILSPFFVTFYSHFYVIFSYFLLFIYIYSLCMCDASYVCSLSIVSEFFEHH